MCIYPSKLQHDNAPLTFEFFIFSPHCNKDTDREQPAEECIPFLFTWTHYVRGQTHPVHCNLPTVSSNRTLWPFHHLAAIFSSLSIIKLAVILWTSNNRSILPFFFFLKAQKTLMMLLSDLFLKFNKKNDFLARFYANFNLPCPHFWHCWTSVTQGPLRV